MPKTIKEKGLRVLVYLGAMILILGVTLIAGCVGGAKEIPAANHFDASGVSFDYPGTWVTTSPSSQHAIVSLADPQAETVSITVEKRTMPSGYTLKTFNDELVISMKPTQVLSGTFPTVAGIPACETVFKANDYQVRIVNLEKNGNMYTILCSAPAATFSSAQASFNIVINSLGSSRHELAKRLLNFLGSVKT